MARWWMVLLLLVPGCGRLDGPQPRAEVASPEPEAAVLTITARDQGPQATLTYEDRTQKGQQGSFCWESEGVGSCGDIAGYERPESFLKIPRGTTLIVLGDGEEPSAYLADPPEEGELGGFSGKSKEIVEEGSDQGILDAEPGLYLLRVFSYFDQGDSGFAFGVEIVEPGD